MFYSDITEDLRLQFQTLCPISHLSTRKGFNTFPKIAVRRLKGQAVQEVFL